MLFEGPRRALKAATVTAKNGPVVPNGPYLYVMIIITNSLAMELPDKSLQNFPFSNFPWFASNCMKKRIYKQRNNIQYTF